MAERIRSSSTKAYIDGNTVRKLRPARAPEKGERQKPKKKVSYRVRRNQEKALQVNLPYVLMFTVALICTLYLCINYLQVQSTMTTRIHNIETIEKELEFLKSENDALETRINTSLDLDYVYRVATEELGMVYPNKNQVILYNKTESEYVRQYEDIPKH